MTDKKKTKTSASRVMMMANQASSAEEKFTGVTVEPETKENESLADNEKNQEQQSIGAAQSNETAAVQTRQPRAKQLGLDYAKKNPAFEGERTTNVGLYLPVKAKLENTLTVTNSNGTLQDLVNNIVVEWLRTHRDELTKLAKKVDFDLGE